ncbi:hypothetical protein DV702_04155 [Sporosarcina sp. PTS2304]|uniref:hypothetical protein n=1 Tax=Sporosarcina sp. PTS2304 TaxID=2283194 RepID=UPI000E0DDE32|nr:hypothetical protein [Sporosarcina sp. PTS2304]AXH98993.1 hypothetical protein DV702_04155 [Sporosarcina sp. PTS2304]
MDVLQLIQQMKMLSDDEAKRYAAENGVQLSIAEIQQLRPLLDEVSLSWLFTGVPPSFIERIAQIIGYEKTQYYLQQHRLQ